MLGAGGVPHRCACRFKQDTGYESRLLPIATAVAMAVVLCSVFSGAVETYWATLPGHSSGPAAPAAPAPAPAPLPPHHMPVVPPLAADALDDLLDSQLDPGALSVLGA